MQCASPNAGNYRLEICGRLLHIDTYGPKFLRSIGSDKSGFE